VSGSAPKAALLVTLVVAVIGFISSPVWGPPICQAVGVCERESPAPSQGPSQSPSSAQPSPVFPSFSLGPIGTETSIFLSLTGGPAGSQVKVSGEGFAPGETVVLRFHTSEVGTTVANEAGSFSSVEVTVPQEYAVFAPQQFQVIATGKLSVRSARAPFTVSG